MFFLIKSLERRLGIYVTLGLLIFSIITGGFTYRCAYRYQLNATMNLQNQLVRTIQKQIEVAVYAINEDIASETLIGLLTNPVLKSARIESIDGIRFDQGIDSDTDFSKAHHYPLFSPINETERIGTLILIQDDRHVSREAGRISIFLTIVLLLQILITAILITGVSRRVMSKPIADLAQSLVSIIPGSGQRLSIKKIHVNDEIGMLSNRINSLIDASELALAERSSAMKAAEDATRAKSEFLSNMSHEIRTPMNAVIGFTELIMKTKLTDKQLDYLYKIDSSAKSLLGIINDILDFSKIEAGKLEMESINFRLDDLINNITDILSVKAAEKNIELTSTINSSIPNTLKGDPLRLNQVLTNIANNAVKFTESGHIHIKVELVNIEECHCMLKFSITDTGIGMTKEQISKLFFAFSQGDTSVTRKFGGTGLGLTISKKLVEMMGGEIMVESEQGKGSTFSFTAGFAFSKEEPSSMRPKPSVEDQLDIRIEGAKVLLVEDNELNQQVAKEILESAGMIVEIASNGREGVDAVFKNVYDIVLMDIQMPVMGGYEATQLIRKEARFADLPIIAMTAHALHGYREHCIDIGMNDYVSKPIDPAVLFSVIMRWIKPGLRSFCPEIKVQREQNKIQNDAVELPDALPGIDIQAGLQRINRNKQLYKQLLFEFATTYANLAEEIRTQINQNNFTSAHQIAHTVKGVAGNLAIDSVQFAACELEIATKEHQPGNNYAQLLSNLEDALKPVMKSIKSLEKDAVEKQTSPKAQMDLEKVKPLLTQIDQLLNVNDSYVEDYINIEKYLHELKNVIGSGFDEQIKQIEEAIHNYDLKNAQDPLQHIMNALEITYRFSDK
ncbi:MAG: response regulator [Desulfobacterales bacterium]|nr:response regulator [Desulfobacterales bacterium]